MEIPEGITLTVEGMRVKAKGPKGEAEMLFKTRGASIKMEGRNLTVICSDPAIKGTLEGHIKNLVYGVQNGYSRKLKIIYAHFPFTLEVKGNTLSIKNMLGEKLPRTCKIVGNTKIEVKGQEVIISGPDKQAVGQTIANIKTALRTRDRDCRVFQDGIYEIV